MAKKKAPPKPPVIKLGSKASVPLIQGYMAAKAQQPTGPIKLGSKASQPLIKGYMATMAKANKGKPKAKGKTPFNALLHPPPGSYDPSLDAALRASARGLGDVQFDTDTSRERNASDYITASGDIERQKDELYADRATQTGDIEQAYSRNLSDLLQERGYSQEDYGNQIAALNRNYQQLGNVQKQAGNQRGLLEGGYQAQAAAKRAANQAIEKAPMDTAFSRAMTASQTSEQRLGEDRGTSLRDLETAYTRNKQGLNRSGGQLGLNYQRQGEDLTTQLARAQRENSAFGLDTQAQKIYQAVGSGLLTPAALKKKAKPKAPAKPKVKKGGR